MSMDSGNFERYYVDIHSVGGPERLVRQLAEHGFATFNGIGNRDSLLRLARPFMDVLQHRDSDPDGVTVISGRCGEVRRGFAGFSRAELLPHTEGSALRRPPGLLLLTCAASAEAGGESLVLDGRALHEVLAADEPATLRALATARSAHFGDEAGHLGSVFEDVGYGRIAVRLRLDDLARFSPDASRALSKLRELMDRFRVEFRMNAGQGYALQNGRWLHGRTRFTGDREMLRILGHPLPGSPIQFGFASAAGLETMVSIR